MEFHSLKVLRSHIESIPIPIVEENIQDNVIQLVDALIAGMPPEASQKTYEQIDQLIFELFHLTPNEQNIIKHAINNINLGLWG